MKIFLDTADITAIKEWAALGIIDGVTTNPSLLARAGSDPKKIITEIMAILPEGEISVEVTMHKPQDVYEQAKKIAALSDQILVKIPCHVSYYGVIKKLVDEDIALNITLVFSVLQAFMMNKLGVLYVSPFVGRWDDIGVDGMDMVEQMCQMRELHGFETQILAASLRSVRDMQNALMAGADVATVPPALLSKAVEHPLTDKGMELFDADWKKLSITQFP
jgi:transaldolase